MRKRNPSRLRADAIHTHALTPLAAVYSHHHPDTQDSFVSTMTGLSLLLPSRLLASLLLCLLMVALKWSSTLAFVPPCPSSSSSSRQVKAATTRMMAERFYNKWSRADFVLKSALAAVRSWRVEGTKKGGEEGEKRKGKQQDTRSTGIDHLTPISLLSPRSLQAAVIPVIKGGAMARDAQAAERLVLPIKYVRGVEGREGGREDKIAKGRKAR